ncbi:FMN-linked oxidoreductase [Hesseltinella vesiculosa]|uniref:FMN-linked oxidoreductase n=1 Tax=Hesseltinella vesiculosa TaxID=101127 RepID=A0A1X2GGI3_9FUNG|nr:FMN-linked oxidoreductase [Hesseltinella vesiculosa]
MQVAASGRNEKIKPGTPVKDAKKTLLFSPITTKSVTAHNRIVVAPMCQYSAENGRMNHYHLAHYGSLALKGPGTVIIEATAVEARGRISPNDLGLWEEAQVEPLRQVIEMIVSQGSIPGIQLAHAGRKASMGSPFSLNGYSLVPEEQGGWPEDVVGPSDLPFNDQHAKVHALTLAEMQDIKQAWVDAAKRALRAGVKVMQIHGAHGYLLSNFVSGNTNLRTDDYGGSFENRIRYPLEVIQAVRDVWPQDYPFWVRISSSDVKDGQAMSRDDNGWDIYQSIEYAKELKKIGVDVIDCSTGGNLDGIQYPAGPCWQVPYAEAVKKEAGIATGAVGIITKGTEAEDILQQGKADYVCVAREFLRDSGFVLTAADQLGVAVKWPNQYERAYRERAPKL